MPSVIYRKNGKAVNMPWVLTAEEVDNLKRNLKPGESYTLINVVTRRRKTIKGKGKKNPVFRRGLPPPKKVITVKSSRGKRK